MATYYLPSSGYYSTGQTTVRWRIKIDETITTSERSLYCTVLASRTDSYATTDARGSVTFYLNDVQQSSSSWAYGDKPIPDTNEVTMATCTMSLPLSTTSAKITATFSMPSINVGTQTNGGTISFSTSKIKLTLNPNGGSGGTSAVWYYYGVNTFYSDEACTNVITAITRPTRAGYTFVHYYGDGTCGGTADERYIAYDNIEFASDLCTDITKDATLYAKWSPNTYTVTYNANSGSGTMDSSTATYGQNFITNQNLYTRTGYTFNGWNESSDGTGTVWALGSPGVYEYGTPWKWNYTNDITLYAQWEPNTIKITLDKAGGTGGTDEIYFSYGTHTYYSDSNLQNEITNIEKPTKDGYKFVHYYGDGTCGGTANERYVGYDDANPFSSDLCTDIYQDATLYALWKSNQSQDVYICCDTGKIYARSYIISEDFYIDMNGDIYAPAFTVGSYFAIDANGVTATEFIEGVPN